MVSCERRYQDVIGPALPGKVERRLLQLHHVLVSAVGPVFGTQLSCVGPATDGRNRRQITLRGERGGATLRV